MASQEHLSGPRTGQIPHLAADGSGPAEGFPGAVATTASGTTLSFWRRWTVLGIVSSALLLIALDNTILYTALPTLTSELGATASEQLWIINAYPLVIAGLLPGSGALGDRFGHKRIFQAGLVIFGAASVAAAFSPSSEVLIASRALLAIGAAAMMPATLALIRITFPVERERNLAIAIWAAVATVGMALGPIVSGVLLEFFWWGSVFLVNVPIVLAASVLIIMVGPANVADPRRRWDGVSSAQVMVGLAASVLALKTIAETPVDWPVFFLSAVVGIVSLTVFARRQMRLTRLSLRPEGRDVEPLMDFTIFRNAAFSAGVVAAGASIFAIAGLQLATTQRFQLVEGFSPLHAGLIVSALALGSMPFALFGGAILHRVGLLMLIGGGLSAAAVGAALAVVSAVQDSLSLLVVGFVVIGAGLGASMSVASTAIMGNVPPRRAGMAASIEEVSYEFGGLVGVAMLGSLITFVYTAALNLPQDAEQWAGQAPAAVLTSEDSRAVAAAAEAFDLAYLVVLVAVAVVMLLGAAVSARMLRDYGPGTESQAYPGNH